MPKGFPYREACLLVLVAAFAAAAGNVFAQLNAAPAATPQPTPPPVSVPYLPVEGTEAVDVEGFGRLPKEIIWTADNSTMVLIPGGKYTIGVDNPKAKGFEVDEGPAVEVEVSPFYIDKTEIIYGQYQVMAERWGLSVPRALAIQGHLDEDSAVSGISYLDALTYAENLGKDLPTEAEWEIAGRGPEGFIYPWGNEPLDGFQTKNKDAKPNKPGSNPKDISPFGVMDLAGNVGEWTKDYYQRDYHEMMEGKTDPIYSEPSESRTVRGGDFYGRIDGRLVYRRAVVPVYTPEEVGARTVFRLRKPPKVEATPTPIPTPSPTPSMEEKVPGVIESLLPHFQDPSIALPEECAGRAGSVSAVDFANFSSEDLILGFLDPTDLKLYGFPTEFRKSHVGRINIPSGGAVLLLAYPKDGKLDYVANLGKVNAMSKALVVVEPQIFNEITLQDGKKLSPEKSNKARQVYQADYVPFWYEFEVKNETDMPIEVFVNAREKEFVKQVIEPAEVYRYRLPKADLEVKARYVGATEDFTSNVLTFSNDDRTDYRALLLTEDENSNDKVRVITRRMAPIRIEMFQAKIPTSVRQRYVYGSSKK